MSLGTLLHLTWVNPEEVLNAYLAGEFSKQVSRAEAIHASVVKISADDYSDDFTKEMFILKDKGGSDIVMTASSMMAKAMEHVSYCWYCRHKLEPGFHDGIVMNITKEKRIHIHEGVSYPYIHLNFNLEYPHCDMNCALKSIRENPNKYPVDAEQMLLRLHNICYPGTILEPAQDKELSEDNLGPLCYNDYKKGNHCRYKEVPGMSRTAYRRCYTRT